MAQASKALMHKVHQYERIESKNVGRSATYRCVLPGCNHWILETHIIGKEAVCCRCGNNFIIKKFILHPWKLKKVHCDQCFKPTWSKKDGRMKSRNELPDAGSVLKGEKDVNDFIDSLIHPKKD